MANKPGSADGRASVRRSVEAGTRNGWLDMSDGPPRTVRDDVAAGAASVTDLSGGGAAGRLAIDEQPEPVLATEFAGIGSVL